MGIVIILFALYVGVTQGWICTDEEDPTKWKLPRWSSEEQAKKQPYVKRRADSVLTISKTELPVLPEAPATWYYTDAPTNNKDRFHKWISSSMSTLFLKAQHKTCWSGMAQLCKIGPQSIRFPRSKSNWKLEVHQLNDQILHKDSSFLEISHLIF